MQTLRQTIVKNIGSSMTSLEDLVSVVCQLGGAIIRKGQHSLRANVIFNGRSLELEATRFRGGVMVARRRGSVVAFDWFQKQLADFTAKHKEETTEIDALFHETECITQDFRASRAVNPGRWRSLVKRVGLMRALPMTGEGCEACFQALTEKQAQQVMADV